MDGSELFILIFAAVFGFIGFIGFSPSVTTPLAVKDHGTVGLVRIAVFGAVTWILYVLFEHSDPSVTLVYKAFYLVIGLALLFGPGHLVGGALGGRMRTDVIERGNWSAALFHAAFVFSTGLIFGGCLWGEADAEGDDEGGWWIPLGFFAMGWGSLVASLLVYRWQEKDLSRRIRQEREGGVGASAAVFTLSVAWVLTEAVSGDFHGWFHGVIAVAAIAGMVIGHELLRIFVRGGESMDPGDRGRPLGRMLESATYLGFGAISWWINRNLDRWTVSGELPIP